MTPSSRLVVPEVLDELAADDPRAQRSRRDLKRIHRFMRSAAILKRMIAGLTPAAPPRRLIELGAGDGTLMLAVARSLGPRWSGVELSLLDRLDIVADDTRAAYRRLGWEVRPQCMDVIDWARTDAGEPYDLVIASLFLHHFEGAVLDSLMRGISNRARAFIAVEPRRDALGSLAASGVGLIGANAVTRGDAVKSVHAGFRDRELSAAWDHAGADWAVNEFRAVPFTHCFMAVRRRGTPAEQPGG